MCIVVKTNFYFKISVRSDYFEVKLTHLVWVQRISDNWDTPQILPVVGKVKHLDMAFIFIVNLIVSCEPMWFSGNKNLKY